MSEPIQIKAGDREDAARWFLRLNDAAASEADAMAFAAWLEGAPARREAFDAVEAAWVDVEPAAVEGGNVVAIGQRQTPRRMVWLGWSGAALAASVALAIVVVQMRAPAFQTFETAAGQTRTVALADGSKVALSGGTSLKVRLRRDRREAVLDRGEADFDIVHDPARPFSVAAGDDTIWVLGTEFDVLRNTHTLTVAVSRGAVSVSPPQANAASVTLPAGQILRRTDGAPDQLAVIAPLEASAWRNGNLIYRERPLSEVAEDLSRHLPKRVTVASDIADLPVTGVLKIADEEAVVERLQTFLEIGATVSPTEIHLQRRPEGH